MKLLSRHLGSCAQSCFKTSFDDPHGFVKEIMEARIIIYNIIVGEEQKKITTAPLDSHEAPGSYPVLAPEVKKGRSL